MNQILKFTLLQSMHTDIILTEGAKILHFANQYETPTLWVQCDPTLPSKTVRLTCVMTGRSVPDTYKYIGTALFDNSSFVLHCYERVD